MQLALGPAPVIAQSCTIISHGGAGSETIVTCSYLIMQIGEGRMCVGIGLP